jgi:hypothetical protein
MLFRSAEIEQNAAAEWDKATETLKVLRSSEISRYLL